MIPTLSRAAVWRKSWLYAELTALIPITVGVGSLIGLTLGMLVLGIAIGALAHLVVRAFVAWCFA